MEPLKYLPFTSKFDVSFWHKFSEKKLNDLKLSEENVQFTAEYSINSTISHAIASVGFEAFDVTDGPYVLRGDLINKNSIELFKDCDKKDLLKSFCEELISNIKSGQIFTNPELLNRMILLSFADLKKFHFYHWSAFPSLSIPDSQFQSSTPQLLRETFSPDQLQRFAKKCLNRQFFLLEKSSLEEIAMENIKKRSNFFVVFADPSTDPGVVGWTLRNFLLLIGYHMPEKTAKYEVIALRGSKVHSFDKSLLFSVTLKKITFDEKITYVGWEKNEKGQYGPRLSNLASSMNPELLADSAVELNLKLMRWRLAPELELERISARKCLLLGAGTLGCNVARCLMGWGMRNITFVDNGKVSYSNPVRQSLFTFDDSLKGGKKKAEAASEALLKIFPKMETTAIDLTIPMPGHNVNDSEAAKTQETVKRLEDLIESHDILFLLLDTKEARWLPTVLGKLHNKIVINAALGFDKFLVMRHGTAINELGCYFCNDVVGPTNSVKDRTLDQQCTVSRPGISFMAASLAVELAVAIIQHDDGNEAKADNPCQDQTCEDSKNILGYVPHQIRFSMSEYHFMTPSTSSFHMCPACSPKILNEYQKDGFNFLMKAFNDSCYLENVSGLAEMREMTKDIEIIELDDSENELSL